MHITSLACLQVEASDPPYHLRRDMLMAKHQLKLEGLSTPHPTVKSLQDDIKFQLNRCKIPKTYKSYYTTLSQVQTVYQLNTIKTKTVEFLSLPPWQMIRPNIDLSLHDLINK